MDSSMNPRNWPRKGLPLEVTFAPTNAVSRYENGGLITHVAMCEFADSFVQKYDFLEFANKKIRKSMRRSRFLKVPKPSF